MRIYLDMCSLQRPLDDKVQLRVALEAEAILGVLAFCEAGEATLLTSEALVFETERNPHQVRKSFAHQVLSKAGDLVETTKSVADRAKEFVAVGIKPLDALHLASAIEAQADYFCTCDGKLLTKAKAVAGTAVKVVSPLELIEELA